MFPRYLPNFAKDASFILILQIPSNITYEQAATLPAGASTAYLGMYNKPPHGMGLVSPLEASGPGHYKNNPFIVLGGASSVGQAGSLSPIKLIYKLILFIIALVLQFAKLSGFNPIITTASLKHTDYLKSFGATHVLDRNLPAPDIKSEVRKIASRPVEYVYDAVSSSETQNLGLDLLVPGGSLLVVLDAVVSATDKRVHHILATRLLDYNSGPLITLYSKLTELVENDSIRV
jgi:NADPH:quinone reductase-like Zn-dependent oxidoreductase